MVGSRTQRQIDRLLDEAEATFEARDWLRLIQLARDALSLDPENADAHAFEQAAVRNLEAVAAAIDGVPTLHGPALPLHPSFDMEAEQEREQAAGRARTVELLDRAADLFSQQGANKYLRQLLARKLGWRIGEVDGDVSSSIDAVAAKVFAEKLDLTALAAPIGTVTIVFSDIEGSTELTARLGDQRWMELLHEHNGLVRRIVSARGGFEVKSRGDGFMLAFSSATAAVRAAIDVQREMEGRNETAETPIHLRIGMHTGESVREADDFYGTHVNLAARIADQARACEILVSSLLRELTEPSGAFKFGEPREVELKGIGARTVHVVEWAPTQATPTGADARSASN